MKNSSTTINWIAGAAAVYFIGSAIAGAIKRRKATNGIGAVARIKRRIYKEVSLAQDAGVDFSKKFPELTNSEKDALEKVGQEVGWKQSKRSIESGKSYIESYYGSLRRAWNAVSGVFGIGNAYNVRDAQGNVVLTWIEDAAAHVQQERDIEDARRRAVEADARATEARKQLRKTKRAIERGDVRAEKDPKAKKSKAEEKEERTQFAKNYLHNYLLQHPDETEFFTQPLNENDGSRADIIIREFINGDLQIKRVIDMGVPHYKIKIQGEWREDTYISNKKLWAFMFGLLKSWNDRGWNTAGLNETRRDLLEKAAHMQVVIEGDDGLGDYNKEFVTGDDRYNYLDLINYIVVVSMRYDRGGNVYYPVRSYPDEESAMRFARVKNNTKVVPIYDINLERISGISGIGYAPGIENELWEIWREQLEYGDTNYDYETWRAIYGDEYVIN